MILIDIHCYEAVSDGTVRQQMSHLCQLVNPLYEDKREKPLTSVSLLTKILRLTPTRESFAKWLGNEKIVRTAVLLRR